MGTIVVFGVFFNYFQFGARDAAARLSQTFDIFVVEIINVGEILWASAFAHTVSVH